MEDKMASEIKNSNHIKGFLQDTEIIDLSVPISPNFFEMPAVKQKVIDHKQGADILGRSLIHEQQGIKKIIAWIKYRLGKGIDHRNFPDEKGLSLMTYTLTTHTGTHMDAPYHYSDIDHNGQPAKTITDIPLNWCLNKGVLIDVSNGNEDEPVSCNEIIDYLNRHHSQLHPNNIVLIHTKKKQDQDIGNQQYFFKYRGMTRESVQFLVEQGIKIIGIDSFSFDPPFKKMIRAYLRTKDKNVLWPAHFYGREREYCQLERLCNLEKLKAYKNFMVSCFPIKLMNADAAWCRVVAIINKQEGN